MTDRLSDYGYSFQIKIVSALLRDSSFLQQVHDILEASYFENESIRWLSESVISYHLEYKESPTLEVFKVMSNDVEDKVLQTQIVDNLKDVIANLEATDLEFVKSQTLDFCRNQNLKKAIMTSVDLLQSGDYDGIKSTIDTAMKAGTERNIGLEYADNVQERYTVNVRDCVPTEWDVINKLADGGLAGGELGVFVAPAGIGKSWALANVGAHAVKQGKTVIHYTLELNQNYVGLRYDSIFTGIPAQELKYNIEDVEKTVNSLKGELVVKYFPTKGGTVNSLAAHIEKCRIQGKKPDMIIVDYADLLKGQGLNNREVRHELGNIYEDLRGLAGELDVPIWTASQANRSAINEEIIQADKIAESYSKIMIADFVISLSRKLEDKTANTGRWHLIKNRFGPDGITFPSKMNASNGHIDIYEPNSAQGQETQQEINQGSEYIRKMLKDKFANMPQQ
jgi:hypothetical protein